MRDAGDGKRPRLNRADLAQLRDAMIRQTRSTSRSDTFADAGAALHPTPANGGTILLVCTGNICRSPLAELVLRAGLSNFSIRVDSAGTHAPVGEPMTEPARRLALARGADARAVAEHRARLLDVNRLATSDLVLAMTRRHRTAAAQMLPTLLRRTFTIREFARLTASLSDDQIALETASAGADVGTRLRALATLASSRRGFAPAPLDEDDVIDPYRQSQETYELSARQLDPAVTEVKRAVSATLRS